MSQENVELIRRGFEAFNRGDLEGALAVADPVPEFEFVPHGVLIPDLSSVQRGPDGLRRLWEAFFVDFDDLYADIHELIDAGDQVFSSFTLRGRGKQSGGDELRRLAGVDRAGRQSHSLAGFHRQGPGPRSRRAAGVGDVAGERRVSIRPAAR